MAASHPTFLELMDRVRQGSAEAGQELYDRYGHHVLRVVRHHLPEKLRPKFDSLDFAQDVWASFFAAQTGDQKFDTPVALAVFLAEVARNKVAGEFRKQLQGKFHNVNHEKSLDGSARFHKRKLIGREPTGSQAALANEAFERMAEGQPAAYRRILELLHQGHTHVEIAAALGVNERTIRRLLLRLQRSMTNEPEGPSGITTGRRIRRQSGPGLHGIPDAGSD
jgi:RNA polymerase sigma factor (sigma-70 family)